MRTSLVFTVFLCLFGVQRLSAQRIENLKAEVVGEKVFLTYDLIGTSEAQKFRLQLYASIDNFTAPLMAIRGDAGGNQEIPAGTRKRVEWDPKGDVKEYSGMVTFELRAEVVGAGAILPLKGPSVGTKYKRGKSIDITWQGGKPGEPVTLDLVKGGVVVNSIAKTTNTGKYLWTIPKETSKGSDYQIRMMSGGNTLQSGNFQVKGKMPLILKVLPVVAVGGVLYVLLSGSKDGEKDKGSDLPSPPEPN